MPPAEQRERMHAVWLPKTGHTRAEWEDGFAFSEVGGRAAIADGASASAHARRWAGELSAGAIVDPYDPTDLDALEAWLGRRIEAFADAADAPDAAAPWYAAEVAQRDAYATMLHVTLTGDSAVALAVGDCTLFAIDTEYRLVGSWPATDGDDFGANPDLVSSSANAVHETTRRAKRCRLTLDGVDHLVLTTDAMAEWALTVATHEPAVWRLLAEAAPSAVERLVGDLRDADEIVNDDVTVLRIDRSGGT